jgi:hypothetical protein
MRTHVYVDSFNLYYGAIKGTPYKWLNLVEPAKQVLPTSDLIERVKYFIARVSGAVDPDAPRRQHAYLSALKTPPEVEIFYGRFLAKAIWRPITIFRWLKYRSDRDHRARQLSSPDCRCAR